MYVLSTALSLSVLPLTFVCYYVDTIAGVPLFKFRPYNSSGFSCVIEIQLIIIKSLMLHVIHRKMADIMSIYSYLDGMRGRMGWGRGLIGRISE